MNSDMSRLLNVGIDIGSDIRRNQNALNIERPTIEPPELDYPRWLCDINTFKSDKNPDEIFYLIKMFLIETASSVYIKNWTFDCNYTNLSRNDCKYNLLDQYDYCRLSIKLFKCPESEDKYLVECHRLNGSRTFCQKMSNCIQKMC